MSSPPLGGSLPLFNPISLSNIHPPPRRGKIPLFGTHLLPLTFSLKREWTVLNFPMTMHCLVSKVSTKYRNTMFFIIYWTPKETLQSSLLYYFIKCNNMAFLHLVKVVRYVFEDKCQIWTRCSKAKLLYVDLNGLHDMHDISTSGYYDGDKH